MSTQNQQLSLETALTTVPSQLRSKFIQGYTALKTAALENQYDAIGMRAGKLAEVLLRVLQNELTQSYTPLGERLGNFKDECEKLEKTSKDSGPESLRILIPRALSFLYTLRNKRDIGHIGGDVDANEIDSLTAIRILDWCLCELVRVCHKLTLEDAQVLCDAIAERRLPVVWSVLGRKRVLDKSLSFRDQTLLLLYSEIDVGVPTEDLLLWTEHSSRAHFRRDVLSKLHRDRFIEWDHETEMAVISPIGICEVEKNILPKLNGARERIGE